MRLSAFAFFLCFLSLLSLSHGSSIGETDFTEHAVSSCLGQVDHDVAFGKPRDETERLIFERAAALCTTVIALFTVKDLFLRYYFFRPRTPPTMATGMA